MREGIDMIEINGGAKCPNITLLIFDNDTHPASTHKYVGWGLVAHHYFLCCYII